MVNDQTTVQPKSVVIIRSVFDHTYCYRWIIVSLVILVLILHAGLYTVKIGEVATLRRFGKLVKDNIQPGLYFRIPLGIDKVDKVLTSKIYNLGVDGQIGLSMPMLTGDMNYIVASLDVQYQITRPERYLFRNEVPEEFLKEYIRSVFIDTVSTLFVDMVLSTDKSYVEETVLKKAQDAIENIGLGITLLTVNLTMISPPVDAIAAFRAVNDAKAKKLEMGYNAKTRREKVLALARGEHDKIIENAKSGARHRIEIARSDASRFNDILVEKKRSPEQTLITEYWKVVSDILGKARLVVLAPGQDPDITVNLLRRSTGGPPQLPKRREQGRALTDIEGTKGVDGPHPGTALAHAPEKSTDRKPGAGIHETGKEAHHYNAASAASNIPSTHTLVNQPSGQTNNKAKGK